MHGMEKINSKLNTHVTYVSTFLFRYQIHLNTHRVILYLSSIK